MADLRILSLCSGVGGLELGVHLATGGRSRVVAACERDPFAAELFLARTVQAGLGDPPVWCGDLAEFPAECCAGGIDLVSAGYPCQPFSAAGKRGGDTDERWIWPSIVRIIRDVGPRLVFLENVRGHLSLGFGRVLGDLADCGFDAVWSLHSAEAVGAPHRRERVFILAYRAGPRRAGTEDAHADRGYEGEGARRFESKRERDGIPNADRDAIRAEQGRRESRSERPTGGLVSEPDRREHARRGSALPLWPPGPTDAAGWAAVLAERPDLEPALDDPQHRRREANGGTSKPKGRSSADASYPGKDAVAGEETQPEIRRVADGLPDWMDRAMADQTDRLRCLGNAVVPLTAAVAFRGLAMRAGIAPLLNRESELVEVRE